MLEIVVVAIAALLTSILSAVAGLGGGVILLLVITQFVAPTVAIPIQGAIQLISNWSRAVLLRTNISWPVVGWVSILLFPASLLGVAVATSLPEDVVRLVLAAFVLVLAWRPDLLKTATVRSGTAADAKIMLLGVGAGSGFLTGSVSPEITGSNRPAQPIAAITARVGAAGLFVQIARSRSVLSSASSISGTPG